jgi:hypothetical protein
VSTVCAGTSPTTAAICASLTRIAAILPMTCRRRRPGDPRCPRLHPSMPATTGLFIAPMECPPNGGRAARGLTSYVRRNGCPQRRRTRPGCGEIHVTARGRDRTWAPRMEIGWGHRAGGPHLVAHIPRPTPGNGYTSNSALHALPHAALHSRRDCDLPREAGTWWLLWTIWLPRTPERYKPSGG